jgi:membrane associated rhomboid family serine protease
MFIPYKIETFEQRVPYMNWVIIAACSFVFVLMMLGPVMYPVIEKMILSREDFSFTGLIGHMFVHVDIWHLVGNMLFLLVFGNAICSNTNNALYLVLFLACGFVAAIFHLVFDGDPGVGASGAINGIVGLTLALFPNNRVHMAFLIVVWPIKFRVRAWMVILYWFAFDIYGAVVASQGTAYWAHIGGFLAGLFIGLALLVCKAVSLTKYDGRTLLDILRGSRRRRYVRRGKRIVSRRIRDLARARASLRHRIRNRHRTAKLALRSK